jgi:hypothetical protein
MAKITSKQVDKAHKDLKNDARKRIAERGILQFRADPETVLAVLAAADKQKMPVGALLRVWVQEKLALDSPATKTSDLGQRVTILEQEVTTLRQQLRSN